MRKSHSTASSLSEIAKLKISSSNTSSNINNVIIPVNSINNLHENELKTLNGNNHKNDHETNNYNINQRGKIIQNVDNSNENRFHENVNTPRISQLTIIQKKIN